MCVSLSHYHSSSVSVSASVSLSVSASTSWSRTCCPQNTIENSALTQAANNFVYVFPHQRLQFHPWWWYDDDDDYLVVVRRLRVSRATPQTRSHLATTQSASETPKRLFGILSSSSSLTLSFKGGVLQARVGVATAYSSLFPARFPLCLSVCLSVRLFICPGIYILI